MEELIYLREFELLKSLVSNVIFKLAEVVSSIASWQPVIKADDKLKVLFWYDSLVEARKLTFDHHYS